MLFRSFNLANGFLRLREKCGALEACLSIQEDAERQALSPATPSKAVTLAQEIIDRYRNNIYQDDLEEVILAREVLRLLKEREMVAFDHRMALGSLEDEKRLQANLSPSHAQAEVNAAFRDSRFVRLLTYPPVDDQQGRL